MQENYEEITGLTHFSVTTKEGRELKCYDLADIAQSFTRNEVDGAAISVIYRGYFVNSLDVDTVLDAVFGPENKEEAMKRLGKGDETFDYALPQPWVDKASEKAKKHGFQGLDVVEGFVWLYDEKARMMGRPFPLTERARRILEIL